MADLEVTAEVQELAAKTAAVIRQRGWTSGSMGSFGGPVCAAGGIALAGSGNSQHGWHLEGVELDVAAAVLDRIDPGWADKQHCYIAPQSLGRLVTVNDRLESGDEILAALDGIAAGQ